MSKNIYNQDIFLTYVNIPLEEYPQGFSKVLEEMLRVEYRRKLEPQLKRAITDVIEADKVPYSEKIQNEIKEKILQESRAHIFTRFIEEPIPLLPHEVYGAQITHCSAAPLEIPSVCLWASHRKGIFATENLKCYQCDHKFFRHILNELSRG